MSEADNEIDSDGGADVAPKKRKLSGKVLVLFAGLPVALIGGGVAAFLMLSGGSSSPEAATAEHGAPAGDRSRSEWWRGRDVSVIAPPSAFRAATSPSLRDREDRSSQSPETTNSGR